MSDRSSGARMQVDLPRWMIGVPSSLAPIFFAPSIVRHRSPQDTARIESVAGIRVANGYDNPAFMLDEIFDDGGGDDLDARLRLR